MTKKIVQKITKQRRIRKLAAAVKLNQKQPAAVQKRAADVMKAVLVKKAACVKMKLQVAAVMKRHVPVKSEKCEAADPQYPYLSADDKKRIDEINQEVIANLEENGDVHENERPVQHTVAFTNLDDLENYKTAVINKGFVVTKGEEALELYVLHIAPIDRIQLIQNIYYLANLALEMHGVYKGWKSRVSY